MRTSFPTGRQSCFTGTIQVTNFDSRWVVLTGWETGYPEQGRIYVRWSQMGFFWQVANGVWGPLQCMATYRVYASTSTRSELHP